VNNFTSPVIYTVKAEDGSEQSYTVTVSKNASIPGMWNFDSAAGDGYTVSGATQVPGIDGSALQFDGVNDYVLINDSPELTLSTSGSIEIIFKIRSFNPYAGLVHKGTKADFSDESYNLQFWTSNSLRLILTNDAGRQGHLDTLNPLVLEKWYHVVATWDAYAYNIYIDGSLAATKKNTSGTVRDSAGGLVIGGQLADAVYNQTNGNFCFNGIIDRVVIHNKAITSDEVSSHYKLYFPGTGSGLAAYIPRAGGLSTIIIIASIIFIFAALYLIRRLNRKTGLNK
jgi:hypothetical protein